MNRSHLALTHCIELQDEGANEAALEYVKCYIAGALSKHRFGDINNLLGEISPDAISADILLAVLESVAPNAARFSNWNFLKERAYAALCETMEDADAYFNKL